jgi:hypothetical protein
MLQNFRGVGIWPWGPGFWPRDAKGTLYDRYELKRWVTSYLVTLYPHVNYSSSSLSLAFDSFISYL